MHSSPSAILCEHVGKYFMQRKWTPSNKATVLPIFMLRGTAILM